MAFAVNASQTLTFAANAVAAETVVIGTITYTWRATVGSTANEVLVGATAAASAQNLYDAINATAAKSGVTFGSATVANPYVRAKTVTATTVVVQAKLPGLAGNYIPTTETMTQGSWGAATLASGTGDCAADIVNFILVQQMSASVKHLLSRLAYDPATISGNLA